MGPCLALRAVCLTGALAAYSCTRRDEHLRSTDSLHPATLSSQAPASSTVTQAELERFQAISNERRAERERLVQRHLEWEGITDPGVLAAMRRVPRHRFVPEAVSDDAYLDRPLPIGWGQTISQPYIVALMTQAARIQPLSRCLEIGTGSGYQAAILAGLCAQTYSIEYLPQLAQFAKSNLQALGYSVELRTGDGYAGWPEAAPFDVIVVTAAPEKVPQPLLEQLAPGGRMVIPVGPDGAVQSLELWTRRRSGQGADAFDRHELAAVRFVPFLGKGAER